MSENSAAIRAAQQQAIEEVQQAEAGFGSPSFLYDMGLVDQAIAHVDGVDMVECELEQSAVWDEYDWRTQTALFICDSWVHRARLYMGASPVYCWADSYPKERFSITPMVTMTPELTAALKEYAVTLDQLKPSAAPHSTQTLIQAGICNSFTSEDIAKTLKRLTQENKRVLRSSRV